MVKHIALEYVRGDVHTNTIELLVAAERGIIGSFHKVSIKHLHRYVAEFQYRFNRRASRTRFEETLKRLAGCGPLTYAALTREESAATIS